MQRGICLIAQTAVNPFGETPDREDHRMNRRTPPFPAPADRTLNRRTRCPHIRLCLIVLAWLALAAWTAQPSQAAEVPEARSLEVALLADSTSRDNVVVSLGQKEIKIENRFQDIVTKGLEKRFKNVELISTEGTHHSLTFIPHVRHSVHVTPVPGSGGDLLEATAHVAWDFLVKTPDGETLILLTARARRGSRDRVVDSIINIPDAIISGLTFGLSELRTGKLRRICDKALHRAQEAAFDDLMLQLEASRDFRLYAKAEIENRQSPAQLLTEVRFDDGNALLPNGQLDAGEEAELVVRVKNQGAGPGFGVGLDISTDQAEIELPMEKTKLGRLPPGKSREARIPVTARLGLASGEASIRVKAGERRGYDARTVRFKLPTKGLRLPALRIVSNEIDDDSDGPSQGDGNGIAENGETIELLVFVRNDGAGPATDVELSVADVNADVRFIERKVALGVIPPGSTVRGSVLFAIPRTHSEDTLTMDLQVRDGRGRRVAHVTHPLVLPFGSKSPLLVAETRVLHEGREIQELTNDQDVEVEVVTRNDGSLDAEDVAVRVRAQRPGITIPSDSTVIGTLKSGATGLPSRFAFSVPRTFDDPALPLVVTLTQRGFSRREIPMEIPVKIRRPRLGTTFRIAGRHVNAIEQNESTELDVRIRNSGELPARNVKVSLESNHPGVTVQKKRGATPATIQPRDQVSVPFGVHVQRSVPPGMLPLSLRVTQEGFDPLTESLSVTVRSEQEDVQTQAIPEPARPRPSSTSMPPTLALVSPRNGDEVQEARITLQGTIVDEQGIDRLAVTVNGRPVSPKDIDEGFDRQPTVPGQRELVTFAVPISLNHGPNTISLRAYNDRYESQQIDLSVTRLEDRPEALDDRDFPQDELPDLLKTVEQAPSDPRLYALVIGISDYAEAADVPYAARSAQTFAHVLRKALGAQAENVALLTNAEATSGRLRGRLRATLARLGRQDRLVVYYAGHGVPDRADSYLLAQDAVPGSYMEPDLRLSALYKQIAASSVGHALVFIDACFSGRADRDTMIFPGIAPARLQPRPGLVVSDRISVLSAGGSEEFANQDETRGHRLFGYYLMRALLDQGGRRLTMATLHDQVREEVLRASLRLGPEFRQEPELHGNTSARVR